MSRRVVVSAYPLSPAFANWDPSIEGAVLRGLAHLDGVDALEVPWLDGIHPHDTDWFLANVPDVPLVITPLPFVMRRLTTPGYGIASTDAAGRSAALADLRRVAADVATIAERSDARAAVVELHTSPRAAADADALARSLDEVSALDWSGARLVIEHCDAHVPGLAPEKGFLSLDDEIRAVRSSGADIGLWLNWGRSAIELRDADAVTDQIAAAASSGLLDGLVLSGASDGQSAYSGPWIDAHHPFASIDPDARSLLTDARVRSAVRAAGPTSWLGLKVSRHPDAGTAAEVLQTAERHLRALAAVVG